MAAESASKQPSNDDRPYVRSQSTKLAVSSSGVLPNVCIFCNKTRKKVQGKEQTLTMCALDSVKKNIKEAARALNDSDLLVKIGDIGFHSKEVKYHNHCKREYLNQKRDSLNRAKTASASSGGDDANSVALMNIFMYIESSVIDNHRPEYLVSLHRHYTRFLEQVSEVKTIPHKVSTLGEKIIKHFGDRVKLECSSRKEGSVVYSSKANKQLALSMASKFQKSILSLKQLVHCVRIFLKYVSVHLNCLQLCLLRISRKDK